MSSANPSRPILVCFAPKIAAKVPDGKDPSLFTPHKIHERVIEKKCLHQLVLQLELRL